MQERELLRQMFDAAVRSALPDACVPPHLPPPPPGRTVVMEASHPVPDATGQAASLRILDLVRDLGPDDLVLCLISGGGSALAACAGNRARGQAGGEPCAVA
jgi:glycerate 2-kinase